MSWTAALHRRVEKSVPRLPQRVQATLVALIREMEEGGPVRGNWPHYGELSEYCHHCHLTKAADVCCGVGSNRYRNKDSGV